MKNGKNYNTFKFKDKNFLFLTEYSQLFKIPNEEFLALKNKSDEYENILNNYIKKVNPIDTNPPLIPLEHQSNYGLFLCIANMCNARCVYCFAHQGDYGKKQGLMNFDVAIKAIDLYMNKVPHDMIAQIVFFGGEPLMSYKEMFKVCEYTKSKYANRKFRFHIVTNATLLTKEIIDYLLDNNFGIAISIDGGKEVQNAQRPLANGKDSFFEATKNLEYLFEKCTNLHARGTFSNFGLDLYKAYDDLIKLGFKEVHIPPDLLNIKSQEQLDLLLNRLDDLYDYVLNYTKTHTDFPFGLFKRTMRSLFSPRSEGQYRCGIGITTFSVDINGDIFPCHRYSAKSEYKMGNVFDMEYLSNSNINIDINTESCMNCWNRYNCSHGCSYNNEEITGSSNIKNPYWCAYSKKMTELSLSLISELPIDQLKKIICTNTLINI